MEYITYIRSLLSTFWISGVKVSTASQNHRLLFFMLLGFEMFICFRVQGLRSGTIGVGQASFEELF